MTHLELSDALLALQENRLAIDQQYDRRMNLTPDDEKNILDLWNCRELGLQYWEIGKILGVSNEEVYEFLFFNNSRPEKRITKEAERDKQFSSTSLIFDGAATIRLAATKLNIPIVSLWEHTSVTKGCIEETVYGRRIPTTAEIHQLKNDFKINLELWKSMSYDVTAVLNGVIPDSLDRSSISKLDTLEGYNKQVLVRPHIVFGRLTAKMSIVVAAKTLGVPFYRYRAFETATDSPTVEEAKKIAVLYGLTDFADVYTVRRMSFNYEYLIGRAVEKHKRMIEMKQQYMSEEYLNANTEILDKIERNIIQQVDKMKGAMNSGTT